MNKILVISGKGGVGKTFISNSLIESLRIRKFADCDVDAPNLHLLYKHLKTIKKEDYYGLSKVRINKKNCKQCNLCIDNCHFKAINENYEVDLIKCEGCRLCFNICPNKAIELIDYKNGETILKAKDDSIFSTGCLNIGSGTSGLLVNNIKKNLDLYIKDEISLIDGSPGIGCPIISSMNRVNIIIFVAEPGLSSIHDLKRVIDLSRNYNVIRFIVINKCNVNPLILERLMEFAKDENIKVIGKIPYDKTVNDYLNGKISLKELNLNVKKSIDILKDEILKVINKEDIL